MTHDEHTAKKIMRGLANEIGVVAGQHDRTLFALLAIVRELAADNAVVRARIDLVEKNFREELRGWKEGTVATERHSREEHSKVNVRNRARIQKVARFRKRA